MNFSNANLDNANARIGDWLAVCRKERQDVVVSPEAERALACILAQHISQMSQIRRRGETILCRTHFGRARGILDVWMEVAKQNCCEVKLSKEADATLLTILAILVAGASPRTIWGSPIDIEGAFVI